MELLNYIQLLVEAGVGTFGQDIFYETMPQTVTKGICIRDANSGNKLDLEIPDLRKVTFRLIVRAPDVIAGMKLIEQCTKVLNIRQTIEVNDIRIRFCQQLNTVSIYPIDDGDAREFACDFFTIYDYVENDDEEYVEGDE